MILAHLAGIKVFATGGLGGVHRGGQDSFDISADLTELGRTPVAVICSGCKGFLDIGRTLEYLETQGVGVATFADGRTGTIDFPAFWSRESGSKSPAILHNEAEAARVISTYASHCSVIWSLNCDQAIWVGIVLSRFIRRPQILDHRRIRVADASCRCPGQPVSTFWATLCQSSTVRIFNPARRAQRHHTQSSSISR